MPGIRELRQRVRSVRNTAKITHAMQLIAASKLLRAQQRVNNGRGYSEKIHTVLSHLASQFTDIDSENLPPLLQRRPLERVLLLLITPDMGLAGALVSNLKSAAGRTILQSEVPVSIVAVGRKGEQFIARSGRDLLAVFHMTDSPSISDTVSISRYLMSQYESGACDKVVMVFAKFENAAIQRPVVKTVLPVAPEDSVHNTVYIYEPSALETLNALLPRYVETQVYQAFLEAIASEHSARMVAMKNATDNADQLIDDLTLDMNKARQNMITSELLDIIGGVAALS